MRSLMHAYTHGHARMRPNERKNAHAHSTHAHMLAHAHAPEKPVEDPAHPQYPQSTSVLPLEYPLVPPQYPSETP